MLCLADINPLYWTQQCITVQAVRYTVCNRCYNEGSLLQSFIVRVLQKSSYVLFSVFPLNYLMDILVFPLP